MKNYVNLSALMLILLLACNKDDRYQHENQTSQNNTPSKNPYLRYVGSDYSRHIHIDSANYMIASYLESINYPSDTTQLRAVYFNADSMRNFLTNSEIATLKFSLAHKRNYMNEGNYGQNSGASAAALTFVLSGLDEEDDDYIYAPGDMVYELHSSQRLSIDTGNKMIQSYLSGIGSDNNVSLRSMTFDADTMRHYLANEQVIRLKFMIAHRHTYIGADKYGTNCGMKADAFTFVIVGLNASNQPVYAFNNMVMEHTRPCPTFCANTDLLTQ